MRAKRISNDRTGTTKPARTSKAKLEAMGREWARQHGANAPAYGNLVHDRACAIAVREMTGKLPAWGEERLKELGL